MQSKPDWKSDFPPPIVDTITFVQFFVATRAIAVFGLESQVSVQMY